MKITPAGPDDFESIRQLVTQSGLPDAGLREHLATTLIAREAGRLIGSAALELYDQTALLRSVAVDPAHRGTGVGRELTRSALDLARARKVEVVYLLTETAAGFFHRLGFRGVARSAVRDAVRQSVEFVSACPSTALCMALDLEPQITRSSA